MYNIGINDRRISKKTKKEMETYIVIELNKFALDLCFKK